MQLKNTQYPFRRDQKSLAFLEPPVSRANQWWLCEWRCVEGTMTVPAGQAALCPGAGEGGPTLLPAPCTAPRLLCRLCSARPPAGSHSMHSSMHTGSNSFPWLLKGQTGMKAAPAAAALSWTFPRARRRTHLCYTSSIHLCLQEVTLVPV